MQIDCLQKKLESHRKWLADSHNGECADLSNAHLRNADLHNADLSCANLCNADLRNANLYGTDLSYADLSCADLRNANLYGADLSNAYLRNANLYNANLYGAGLSYANLFIADLSNADLRNANLCSANLFNANLFNADLRNADLRNADLNNADLFDANLDSTTKIEYPMACPCTGAFIAWKKATGCIVKLLIPETAKRSSATSRKCRCDKAKVLAIEDLNGNPSGKTEVSSSHDINFIYRVGEIVEEPNFCEDRWVECAPGIHFFITRIEAVNYIQ